MGEAISDWESIVTITEDKLTLLIISSIHMLKRNNNNKKCGRLEVYNLYNLVKESVEFEVSSEVFTETLNFLIENKSVVANTFRNRECISLTKKFFQEIQSEKKNITEQFHQIKKLNHLKLIFLILHQKIQETRII